MDTAASGEQSGTDGSPQQPDSNESGGEVLDLTTADVDIEQPQIFDKLLGTLVKNLAGTWRGSQPSSIQQVPVWGLFVPSDPTLTGTERNISQNRLISLISVYIRLAYQPDIRLKYQAALIISA